jgi:hypothetical protein
LSNGKPKNEVIAPKKIAFIHGFTSGLTSKSNITIVGIMKIFQTVRAFLFSYPKPNQQANNDNRHADPPPPSK